MVYHRFIWDLINNWELLSGNCLWLWIPQSMNMYSKMVTKLHLLCMVLIIRTFLLLKTQVSSANMTVFQQNWQVISTHLMKVSSKCKLLITNHLLCLVNIKGYTSSMNFLPNPSINVLFHLAYRVKLYIRHSSHMSLIKFYHTESNRSKANGCVQKWQYFFLVYSKA